MRPRLCKSFGPRKIRGRREDRVRAAPAVSCANGTRKNAHEHTGSAETLRPSLRNGSTAYIALTPEYRAFMPPSPRENRHIGPVGPSAPPRDLTPTTEASGPHDFAVRFNAVRLPAVRSLTELIPPRHHLRARHCRVHRVPSPRFVTIMIRPSERAGMGENMRVIWGRRQEKFLIFGSFL